ncbi:MAG: hypothetical protein AAGI48_01740 [Verrucomicrobiota bacterium]
MSSTATFLAFLVLSLSASAANLRIIPWDEEVAERKLSIAYGKKVEETGYLHPDARSQAIKIPAEAPNLRLETPDRLDDEGKPLAIKLNIPSGVRTPLLLILPDKKAPTGLRTMIIEDDLSSFKWGTFRMFNVTKKPLVFRWDKKAKTIEPGWKSTSIEPGGNSRNMEIFLYLKGNLEKPFYTAVWEHRSDMRQLVFMVPSSNTALGPVEFKFIPESRIDEPDSTP